MTVTDLEPHAFVIAMTSSPIIHAVQGYLVPETNNLLAVDERHTPDGVDWRITHLPSGRGIGNMFSRQDSLEKAVKVAQGFYREFSQLCDLSSKDIEAICGPFNSMPLKKREEIMARITA